jgi:hypothetical protein
VDEMMNISKITKVLSLASIAVVFILVSGSAAEVSAQRDPFMTPSYNKPQTEKRPAGTNASSGPSTNAGPKQPEKPKGPMVVEPPPIEARIDYYKQIREQAAMNGQEIPKVTSVLLVNEMSVTGIFKTPRGYAAMVEATPIKLSYTIYPGEKFFDGQLVAVEENRLIFRKVTKWSNNKFVSSVENKPLRKYSLQQEIQGTSPSNDPYDPPRNSGTTEAASSAAPEGDKNAKPVVIVSPLEEMTKQPAEKEKDTDKNKKGKKRASKTRKRS